MESSAIPWEVTYVEEVKVCCCIKEPSVISFTLPTSISPFINQAFASDTKRRNRSYNGG